MPRGGRGAAGHRREEVRSVGSLRAVPIAYLPLLASLQQRFHDGITAVPADPAVLHGGDWSVRGLVEHLAGVHHWAAAMARDEEAAPLDPHPSDLADHYRACADELRETLAALPPDAVARTFDGRGPVSFWHRRQLHETLVHLHDLLGHADGVAPVVWADTVDEVVTVLHPRQVMLGRAAAPTETLRLVAVDADRAWVLGPGERPAAVLEGSAERLALLLWGRVEIDAIRISGDADAARRVLTAALTP